MKRQINKKNNQKGMATIETVLLLFIFVLFMGFTTGFYGIIHSGILNSISARAYAFEIIRNRANVTYHRNPSLQAPKTETMAPIGFRLHAIVKPGNSDEEWNAQKLKISTAADAANVTIGPRAPSATEGVAMKHKANPVWIKTAYGICLNAKCGGT